ncbi:uracil-DNA glycosylase [Trypanosoma rangeli]|uniref:Uracil-DNA glycosylase n=1 Tax=Trypanosoma rangeli TaxID=5698 RepID=A0A3R7L167_TRYRA|nr:uracil-DNA glycosylase [Trypanosoma rangeli]RNF05493.1 uracil-DNA glycosylase [Trypanosoma rangeli]|eukprot:RNF05493.1 uracil-DNA glycosylase [Trypanosoma rangeli]
MLQRTLLDFVHKKDPNALQEVIDVDATSDEALASVSRKRRMDQAQELAAVCSKTRTENNDGVCRGDGLCSLIIDPGWRVFLQPLTSADSFRNIDQFIEGERAKGKVIFPSRELIFSAFNSTPLDKLKVVLLGQDPYHNLNQAHGLCFSVLPGVRPPPSLLNMFKELTTDIPGFKAPPHGYLQRWAEQGVLMLNATLTVEAHKANSHARCGWQAFTDGVIRLLSEKHNRSIVFLLWGGFARKKIALIDRKRHLVIENAHPSPLSAAKWWGCRPFSKCNAALAQLGHSPIDWNLPMVVDRRV